MHRSRFVPACMAAAALTMGMGCGENSGSSGNFDPTAASGATTATATSSTAPSTAAEPTRADVRAEAEQGHFDEAIALAATIGAADLQRQYRRAAARVIEKRARAALAAGRYVSARRFARDARRRYGTAAAWAPGVRQQTSQALAAKHAAAQARAQQAKAEREARRQAVRLAQAQKKAAQAAPSDQGTPDYSGMNCDEIGHSYSVPPGSDPDHDADNDGVACESQ